MKFLIVVSCVIAAASAGILSPVAAPLGYASHGLAAPLALAHPRYVGPQHIPVIGPNGVPLDTPEVAAGKAADAVAHAEALARNGDLAIAAPIHLGAGIAAPLALARAAVVGPQHIPVIGPNGVPLETPEVVAAKAVHATAHVEAKARNGDLAVVAPLAAPLAYAAHGIAAPIALAHHTYVGPQHIPVIGPNGVPLDTPEVAAGKAANAVAHVEAKVRNGDLAYAHPLIAHLRKRRGIVGAGYAAPLAVAHPIAHHQHIPVIGPNGVPLETPEVVAAKAVHATAHVEAIARNGDLIAPVAAPLAYAAHGLAAPIALAHHSYIGPQHIPVIGPNGVPLDTPEVVAAKAVHATAHVDAVARNGDLIAPLSAPLAYAAHGLVAPVAVAHHAYLGPQHIPVIGPNGVPLDTPEVAAGKAANAAAHVEAKVRNGDLVAHY